MIKNRLRFLKLFLAAMLWLPSSLYAQVDDAESAPDLSDPAVQQGYRKGRRDSTRARLAFKNGGNDDDYVYVDKIENDTIDSLPPIKNPKLAGWMSVAVPGAGQIYNGQYWKVPVIYGAIGTIFYASQFYNTRYKQLRHDEKFLLKQQAGDTTAKGQSLFGLTNESDIVRYMLKYRRYRDLCYVGMALVYVMNIFDAVVDAHLYDYDVSEDITMHLEPYAPMPVMANQKPAFGARLVIRF